MRNKHFFYPGNIVRYDQDRQVYIVTGFSGHRTGLVKIKHTKSNKQLIVHRYRIIRLSDERPQAPRFSRGDWVSKHSKGGLYQIISHIYPRDTRAALRENVTGLLSDADLTDLVLK